MAYTQQQAQQYYNTLTPEQRAAVDASGGPGVEWFTNAVNAGVPAAGRIAGAQEGALEGGWEQEGGTTLDWRNAAPASEWMGKRQPTPAELRRASFEGVYGASEDGYNRYTDRQLADWLKSWDVQRGGFFTSTGQQVGKPPDRAGDGSWVQGFQGNGTTGGGGGGGGGGGFGGGGGKGGAPTLDLPEFVPPTWQEALADPGYQFAVGEGLGALNRSAAAQGVLRTSGTLKDLIDYGQQAATQQYGNVYNRAAQTYGLNTGAQQAEFAPLYGAWETQYGGNLQKYLQREQNIYGLINQPPPTPPFYAG